MNTSEANKLKKFKQRLNPLNLGNIAKTTNESKKEETSFGSYLNSVRYFTNFDESSFDSKKLYLIKNPYKIWKPIKSKMKKIKDNRILTLNTYYRRTLKNELFFKVKLNTLNKSFNSKEAILKEDDQTISNNQKQLKSTFNISNSNQTNLSKNAPLMNTERTSSTKELTNINLSNISKLNTIDKYNILSYKTFKDLNSINKSQSLSIKMKNKKEQINNYLLFKFLSLNEGYKNLPKIKGGPKHFVSDVKSVSKEKFINHCLKEKEATFKSYKDCHDDNFRIEIKKKLDNRNLFDIFYKDYITYSKTLKSKTSKDSDHTNVLKWEIIYYKTEVNRLKTRKEKLLTKLNRYIKMKQFLIQMRNYSLDKQDDSWMFKKSSTKDVTEHHNNANLIRENRRIKDPEDVKKLGGKKVRRGSVNNEELSKFSSILINAEKNNSKKKKELVRMNSVNEKNPLLGSAVKDIANILNNHIANLLIYQNQLRIELEPLRAEFNRLYKSLKESEERENQLLKLQFLVLPEKKRILKERNEFLRNTLYNINNDLYNSSKFTKMNELIQEKLNVIYKTLIDNKIITHIKMKAKLEENTFEKILYYLKNIEKGLVILNQDKNKLKEEYSPVYFKVIKELNDDTKKKTLEAQRRFKLNMINKQKKEIIDRMTKVFVLDRKKDYYEYGYKKPKVKIVYKKVDPYDELRYEDNNEENEKE